MTSHIHLKSKVPRLGSLALVAGLMVMELPLLMPTAGSAHRWEAFEEIGKIVPPALQVKGTPHDEPGVICARSRVLTGTAQKIHNGFSSVSS